MKITGNNSAKFMELWRCKRRLSSVIYSQRSNPGHFKNPYQLFTIQLSSWKVLSFLRKVDLELGFSAVYVKNLNSDFNDLWTIFLAVQYHQKVNDTCSRQESWQISRVLTQLIILWRVVAQDVMAIHPKEPSQQT